MGFWDGYGENNSPVTSNFWSGYKEAPKPSKSKLGNVLEMLKQAKNKSVNWVNREAQFIKNNPKQAAKNITSTVTNPDTYKIIGSNLARGAEDFSSTLYSPIRIIENLYTGKKWNDKNELSQAIDERKQQFEKKANELATNDTLTSINNVSRIAGENLPYFLVPQAKTLKGGGALKFAGNMGIRGAENAALMAGSDAGQGKSLKEIATNAPINFTLGAFLQGLGEGSSKIASKVSDDLLRKPLRELTDQQAAIVAKEISNAKLPGILEKGADATARDTKFMEYMSNPSTEYKAKSWINKIKDPEKKQKYQSLFDELKSNIGSEIKTKNQNVFDRILKTAVLPGETSLKKEGASGFSLAESIKNFVKYEDSLAGKWKAVVREKISPNLGEEIKLNTGLKKSTINEAKAILNGDKTITSPEAVSLAESIRKMFEDVYNTFVAAGGKPAGKIEDYFPRIYDWKKLGDPNKRNLAISYMMKSGQAKTRAEAESILGKFSDRKNFRDSASLEHHRVLDLPKEFEVSPLKAIEQYIEDNARRTAEIKYFGSKGQVADKMIQEIANVGGDAKFAREVFELMTGIKKYENPVVDTAIKLTYLFKLSLSFITNATQPINSGSKAGIGRLIVETLNAYNPVTAYKAGIKAMNTGAIEDSITKGQAEGISMDALSNTILGLFQAVERKNRTIASNIGTDFAQKTGENLVKYSDDAYKGWFSRYQKEVRQLESIGLDPVKIIEQGGLTPDDIIFGAKGFSDNTQFLVDAMNIPPGAKTNIGRILFSLKSFSYKQTIFIYKEIIREAAHGNVAPLLRLMVLGIPVVYGANAIKAAISGTEVRPEDKFDFRNISSYTRPLVQGTLIDQARTTSNYLRNQYKFDYGNLPGWANVANKISKTAGSLSVVGGDVANMINDVLYAFDKELQNAKTGIEADKKDPFLALKRDLVKIIPFVGKKLSNTKFAFPKSDKTDAEKASAAMYYDKLSEVEKGYTTEELNASRLLHSSKKGTDQYVPTQQKAMIYINLPNVLAGDTKLYRALPDHDPFYDLTPKQQQSILLGQAYFPGEGKDVKSELLYDQPWYKSFQEERSAFYDGIGGTSSNNSNINDIAYVQTPERISEFWNIYYSLPQGSSERKAMLGTQIGQEALQYTEIKKSAVDTARSVIGLPGMPEDTSYQDSYNRYKNWYENKQRNYRTSNLLRPKSVKTSPTPKRKAPSLRSLELKALKRAI